MGDPSIEKSIEAMKGKNFLIVNDIWCVNNPKYERVIDAFNKVKGKIVEAIYTLFLDTSSK